MRVRFTVRSDETTPGSLGAWDGALNGWRTRHLADELEATREAAELELQFDAHGPRPLGTVPRFCDVKPAVQELRDGRWLPPVQLHAWVLTDGQWYGLVQDKDGRQRFIPGKNLRLSVP
ncbi:hypothetical protein ACFTSF_07165 [Kribbella sp. NPDC056951]|uniref:hypothetical protein n=1 Tax=Kribbella sp. NPDC056951 TaxID=3345978 RepID=UPI003631386B